MLVHNLFRYEDCWERTFVRICTSGSELVEGPEKCVQMRMLSGTPSVSNLQHFRDVHDLGLPGSLLFGASVVNVWLEGVDFSDVLICLKHARHSGKSSRCIG